MLKNVAKFRWLAKRITVNFVITSYLGVENYSEETIGKTLPFYRNVLKLKSLRNV